MNRDLFIAILAMDSYNRGYGQGLSKNLPDVLGSTQIGTAAIYDEKADAEAQDAGFYAIAYDWQGEKIISYRGTDGLIRDAITGYGIALGTAGTTQANLAIEFYQAVMGGKLVHGNLGAQ